MCDVNAAEMFVMSKWQLRELQELPMRLGVAHTCVLWLILLVYGFVGWFKINCCCCYQWAANSTALPNVRKPPFCQMSCARTSFMRLMHTGTAWLVLQQCCSQCSIQVYIRIADARKAKCPMGKQCRNQVVRGLPEACHPAPSWRHSIAALHLQGWTQHLQSPMHRHLGTIESTA